MAVEIPKTSSGGGTRILGVPTVSDRVAQTVAAMALEARTEPIFHRDSYGHRPRRLAVSIPGVIVAHGVVRPGGLWRILDGRDLGLWCCGGDWCGK